MEEACVAYFTAIEVGSLRIVWHLEVFPFMYTFEMFLTVGTMNMYVHIDTENSDTATYNNFKSVLNCDLSKI